MKQVHRPGYWGLLITVAVSASACKSVNRSAVKSDTISSSGNRGLQLGSGYDKARRQSALAYCVTGEQGPRQAEPGGSVQQVAFDADADFKQMRFLLTGDASGGFKASQNMQDSLSGQIALAHSSDVTSKKWTIFWRGESGVAQFSGNVHSTDVGKQAAAGKTVMVNCGDEFISHIVYGAGIVATFRLDFSNVQDKAKYGGKLNLGFENNLYTLKASADFDTSTLATSSKVSIRIDQIGGDATGLTGLLASNIVTCSITNPNPCLQTMTNLQAYISGDFTKSLKGAGPGDLSAWVPVRYETQSYANAGVNELASVEVNAMNRDSVDYSLILLTEAFDQRTIQQQRADRLLGSVAQMNLSDAEVARIQTFSRDNTFNLMMNRMAINNCLDQIGPTCDKYVADVMTPRLRTVHPEDLSHIEGSLKNAALFKSPSVGGFGGVPFDATTSLQSSDVIKSITLFGNGTWVDAVAIQMSDDTTFRYGSVTGKVLASRTLGEGETVQKIEVSLQSGPEKYLRVGHMRFVTSKGDKQAIEGGVPSKNTMTFEAPPNARFIGLYGKQGSVIDEAGGIYAFNN